jgi:hypothetical protein
MEEKEENMTPNLQGALYQRQKRQEPSTGQACQLQKNIRTKV